MTSRQAHKAARELLVEMKDPEIIAFHREVSRLARAAYGRTGRYQSSYRMGMTFAQPKIQAWNARMEAYAAHSHGLSVAEYRKMKAARPKKRVAA